jgi:hypothetical protein
MVTSDQDKMYSFEIALLKQLSNDYENISTRQQKDNIRVHDHRKIVI